MKTLTKTLAAGAFVASVAAGALVLSATSASADVACNRYGECWHVTQHYTFYPSDLGVRFYDDAWRDHHRHGYHWRRDRDDDHGYWFHGRWRPFDNR